MLSARRGVRVLAAEAGQRTHIGAYVNLEIECADERVTGLGPDGPQLDRSSDQQPDRAVPRRLPLMGSSARMKARASERWRTFNLIERIHVRI